MNRPSTRTMVAGLAVGAALCGAAFGFYSAVEALLTASKMTQFLVGLGAFGAGGTVAYGSLKGEQY